MTENEKINGWTFEETIKCAENLMEVETNMFKWDVLRHLRDFAENYKEENQQYHAIGTVEDIQQKLAELKQWHTTVINDSIKNSFANSSTSICHNCDHKDEYIEELEAELQALKEKAEPKKPILRKDGTYDCVCGNAVIKTDCYCEDCGQKLDWSEEE